MIDSVVLQLQCQEGEINPRYFGSQQIKYPSGSGQIAIQKVFSEMHRKFKKEGKYYPVITATKRKVGKVEHGIALDIQVSLPKLLYGTNLWEVTPNDIPRINLALQECLKQSGLDMSIERVKSAVLKRVDFCKVVRVPALYGTAKQVTKKLGVFNYKQSSEFHYRDYGDYSDGAALKYFNLAQGYVVYDKVGELLANGYTDKEKSIVQWYKDAQQRRDVLRFELALQRKQTMDAVLRRFIKGKKKDFILEDVLSNIYVSRSILLEAFDKVFDRTYLPIITLAEMKENELETYLREQNMHIGEHSQLFYWVNMAHKIGLAATLEFMREKVAGGSLTRYRRKVEEVVNKLPEISGEIPSLVAFLRHKHEEFKPISPNGG